MARETFVPTARFTYLSGHDAGKVVEVQGAVLRVGTLPSNDVRLQGADAEHAAPVHCKLLFADGRFSVYDNEDAYGLFLNGRLIERAQLKRGDELRFGEGGAALRFEPTGLAAEGDEQPDEGALEAQPLTALGVDAALAREIKRSVAMRRSREHRLDRPLSIGRDATNDVVLDHPQVSAVHARIEPEGQGHVLVDQKSLNGTFVGEVEVARHALRAGDQVRIGPYLLVYGTGALYVYDDRRETEVEVLDLSRVAGELKLLDEVTLRIQPGELVGLLGPSGAGKSTLLRALNGLRPASSGRVLVNGVDLYQHYDHLKQSIGYVPQDDIIHVELSAERTLQYVSLLRLPKDTTPEERARRIQRILELLELSERKALPIYRLSGGQRKRVSLGVELLTEPSLIFLDEPTAGLDPALEAKMMVLFKELAQQGRTVLVTTHLMDNVDLFDKLVVLVRGKLAFFGTPKEALEHFEIADLKELFSKLAKHGPEEWRDRYAASPLHARHVAATKAKAQEPASGAATVHSTLLRQRRSGGQGEGLRQLGILCRRYLEILLRDRRNTALLLLQAPIIGAFVALAMDSPAYILFMLALSAIWFGTNNSAKEIVKELAIYRRERMVNLSIGPYLFSKVLVLGGLATIQCALLLAVVVAFRDVPGSLLFVYLALLLTSLAALLLGLAISALVDSADKANALVPLVLIPQVLFAGIFTPLTGATGAVAATMPSRWSYDLLKRIVMDTHEREASPLVDFALKGEREVELRRLAAEARQKVLEIDALAARVAAAEGRLSGTWSGLGAEVARAREDQQALKDLWAGAKTRAAALETRYAEVRRRIERQRALVAGLRTSVADLRPRPDAPPPTPEALRAWGESRQREVQELIQNYERVEKLVAELEAARAPLAKDRDEAERRAGRLEKAQGALLEGKGTLEREVEALRAMGRRVAVLEEGLKQDALRIQAIQGELSGHLAAGRFVYMNPDDSIAKDAAVLGGYCVVFLVLAGVLQRRRDREG